MEGQGPISIVRDKGLNELLAFLEPNYRVPSTIHVSARIRTKILKMGRLQLRYNCMVILLLLSPLIYGLPELRSLLQLQLRTSLISNGI